MIIKIQPFTGYGTTSTSLDYTMRDNCTTECQVYWALLDSNNVRNMVGIYIIDDLQYAQWDNTNESLKAMLLTHLQLTEDNT